MFNPTSSHSSKSLKRLKAESEVYGTFLFILEFLFTSLHVYTCIRTRHMPKCHGYFGECKVSCLYPTEGKNRRSQSCCSRAESSITPNKLLRSALGSLPKCTSGNICSCFFHKLCGFYQVCQSGKFLA